MCILSLPLVSLVLNIRVPDRKWHELEIEKLQCPRLVIAVEIQDCVSIAGVGEIICDPMLQVLSFVTTFTGRGYDLDCYQHNAIIK